MPLLHSDIDRRSLAMHLLAVQKIQRDPALLLRARAIVARWTLTASERSAPYLEEWQRLLSDGNSAHGLDVAVEDSEHAAALRQSSPLACLLTSQERFAFLRQWRQSHATA